MIGAVVVLYLVTQFVREPGTALMNLVRGLIVGVVALVLVNLAGGYFGFHIGLNPATALTAGLLGLPGVAALVIIHLWLI
ncbi:pro-sigmaK processing inhibitor BofA family protein [Tumebacillus sp. ITR2]|uniref:Pro-sigmaK processing inhibitor BofA family protein n=2 Tax=Tumebacillus amylolyticus TaxID=2801339 RepID=A0ABS1JFG0_9BACL|nr:pro-sigmaK processing inhibitor BofA family protein [Tumebacillus amylolyticus]